MVLVLSIPTLMLSTPKGFLHNHSDLNFVSLVLSTLCNV